MFAPSFPSLRSISPPLLALAAALVTSGCDEEFDSRTQLSGYRVIGIQASPPEVGPDGIVEVSAHDYQQSENGTVYRWSLCLYSQGAVTEYECANEELDLEGEANFVLDLGPNGFDVRNRLEELGPRPNADGTPRSLERGFDIWLKLHSGPDCEDCDRIDTVKRLHLRETEDGFTANQNPQVGNLEAAGSLTPGSLVTLTIDSGEPESYVDPVSGQDRAEEYLYTWYSTEGETDPGLTFGAESQTEWQVPNGAKPGDTIELIVAVRDGRGGLTVESASVTAE